MIHIYSEPQPGTRLKSFGAIAKGAASVLTIQIEIDDPRHLGFLLAELMQLSQAQNDAAKSRPRKLALPPPERTP